MTILLGHCQDRHAQRAAAFTSPAKHRDRSDAKPSPFGKGLACT
jgi:hypothetical protein